MLQKRNDSNSVRTRYSREAPLTDEQIDALTIAEVRAIANRASAALSQLRELGLLPGGVVPTAVARPIAMGRSGHDPAPGAEPFPCAECGRLRPERPGESVQAQTCDTCGNRLPGGDMPARVMNKPEQRRNGVVSTAVTTLTPEERAAKLALPAFDANGMPLEAE